MKFIDRTGLRYGKLIAVELVKKESKTYWKCLCDCGKETGVFGGHLGNGHTQSCGCLQAQVTKIRSTKHGFKPRGKSIPEYKAWANIKERCNNQKNKKYYDYGGRGITVCDRWMESFDNFFEDMGFRPIDKSSIDRIDNNGNYEPGNCRWSEPLQQANNKRNNRMLLVDGETKSIVDFAKEYGLKTATLKTRIYNGWSHDKAVKYPLKLKKEYSNG